MVQRIFGFALICFLLTGCISLSDRVYDDGFQRQVYSIATVPKTKTYFGDKIPVRKKVAHTYLYPDSVLKLKETVYFKYELEAEEYFEIDRVTEYFDRRQPYIQPIDTMPIVTKDALSGDFRSYFSSFNGSSDEPVLILTQYLNFTDSIHFRVVYPMRSSCTSSWQNVVEGKYVCEDDQLRFFVQDEGSLRVDTVDYAYYNDSIVRVSENKIFDDRFVRSRRD